MKIGIRISDKLKYTMTGTNVKKISFKTVLILIFILVFNIGLAFSLFASSHHIRSITEKNKRGIRELARKEGSYIFRSVYSSFTGEDEAGSVRDDDSSITAIQNSFDVEKYDLSISVNIPAKSIDGTLIMTANSFTDTLSSIYLNLYQNMTVKNVQFTSLSISTALPTPEDMKDVPFRHENDYIIIDLQQKLKRNEDFAVKVIYSGSPKTMGFDSFTFKTIYGNPVVYSLSEPNYGPTWWPSKDLPGDKALSSLHITVPRGLMAVSNGLLIDSVQNSDSTTTFNWKSSYPIATYLVSMVVSKFCYWSDTYTSLDGTKQMPVVYYVFPKDSANTASDWKRTPEMIRFFAKTFGEYPFINEKYGMAEFGWTQGSMENQTLTSMGYLLLDGYDTYEEIVVHELSHQWFGDAVTLKDWKNIWLNEGFATYSEALWEEHTKGKEAYLDYMRRFDYGYFKGTVYSPEGYIFSPSVYPTIYQKGGWVLHMLRGVIGEDNFFKLLREYFEKYEYKNADTKDFQSLAEEISGQKLDWFFNEWVYEGTGRPKYEYSWKFEDFQGQPNSGAFTVRLQLKQVQDDRDVYKMPIKINVVTESGTKDYTIFNDSRSQSILLTVDSKPKEVEIDKDSWILKKIAKGKYQE
ncbi:MAG: M1 family metallopeptidase [Ignavibacteria bacterium]